MVKHIKNFKSCDGKIKLKISKLESRKTKEQKTSQDDIDMNQRVCNL